MNQVFNLRMKNGENPYIWQEKDWPNWRYDLHVLSGPLTEVSRAQGVLMGRMADAGLALRCETSRSCWNWVS